MMEPPVSEPMENPTRPAAVADPGPADEPDASRSVFHGLRVRPPNHRAVTASAPVESFATRIAPASVNLVYTVESMSITRSRKGVIPHVVFVPRTANKSFRPQGIPC